MIYQSAVKSHDGLSYMVQSRQALDGTIQQRHIWFETQAGRHDPPWVDPWIAAPCRKPETAFRNMTPAPDVLDEFGELVAALREIAGGHNDARGRAELALRRAGIADA